jgi:hypothetical protein
VLRQIAQLEPRNGNLQSDFLISVGIIRHRGSIYRRRLLGSTCCLRL